MLCEFCEYRYAASRSRMSTHELSKKKNWRLSLRTPAHAEITYCDIHETRRAQRPPPLRGLFIAVTSYGD